MQQTRHSIRNLWRWWEVQSIFLRYGFDILIAQERVQEVQQFLRQRLGMQPGEFEHLHTPERVRLMLEELGPVYVKLGQIVSSQQHSLPPDWQQELALLQDNVPPFPADQVREIVERELDAPPDDIFVDFDMEPFAAASIGQVHMATLVDGDELQEVVVKVQRPGIQEQVAADLAIMHEVAVLLERTTGWAADYDVVGMVKEFEQSLGNELNYEWEANNADRLRRNMHKIDGVHVPHIFWDQTTATILTMERVSGIKVINVDDLREAGHDLVALADTFTRSIVKQLLIDGFFHADPHPGNILVDPQSGTIIYIDTGMVGTLKPEEREHLGNLLIALQEPDAEKLVEIALQVGNAHREVDEEALLRDMELLLNRYYRRALSEMSVADMLGDLLNVLFEHGVRLPSSMTLAIKTMIQLQEIATTLNPDIELADIVRAIYADYAQQFDMMGTVKSLYNKVDYLFNLHSRLHDIIEGAHSLLRDGKFTIEIDTPGLPAQMRILNAIANRMTTGLTLAGITIGSAIAMRASTGKDRWFVAHLGAIGFTVSLVLSVVLIVRGLWAMWQAPEDYTSDHPQGS